MTPPRKKPSEQPGTRLPADLAGPVDVELTHSVDIIPIAFKPGTLAIEPKWEATFTEQVKETCLKELDGRPIVDA